MPDPSTPPVMTLTRARQIARQTRVAGYHQADPYGRDFYVTCPLCQARLDFTLPYDRWLSGVRCADLDAAKVAHLTSPHDDERCPQVPAVRARRGCAT